MIGSIRLILENKRIKYDILIKRKISIIRGDSGTGKSTLAKGIAKAVTDKSFKLDCNVKVSAIPHMDKEDTLEFIRKRHGEIIVADEDIQWMISNEFGDVVNKSDCYFIFITRDKLAAIPYSVDSIYEIESVNKVNRLKQIYNPTNTIIKPDYIVCEDEKSSFILFKLLDTYDNRVKSAKTKDEVINTAISLSNEGKHNILIIADGSAFGQYLSKVIESQYRYGISAYLPESYEFILLHSSLFRNISNLDKILSNPTEFVDSTFKSSEEYFENLLNKLMEKMNMRYKKSELLKCFVDKCCWSREINGYCIYKLKDRSIDKVKYLLGQMPIDFSNIYIGEIRNKNIVIKGRAYQYKT